MQSFVNTKTYIVSQRAPQFMAQTVSKSAPMCSSIPCSETYSYTPNVCPEEAIQRNMLTHRGSRMFWCHTVETSSRSLGICNVHLFWPLRGRHWTILFYDFILLMSMYVWLIIFFKTIYCSNLLPKSDLERILYYTICEYFLFLNTNGQNADLIPSWYWFTYYIFQQFSNIIKIDNICNLWSYKHSYNLVQGKSIPFCHLFQCEIISPAVG